MSFETYAKIDIIKWKKAKFDSKKAFLTSILIIAFFMVAFSPGLFSTDYVPANSTTSIKFTCKRNSIYFFFMTVGC